MHTAKKVVVFLGLFIGIWLGAKYLFPFMLPFILGSLLAFSAEPMVKMGANNCKLPRFIATGIGVTLTLIFLLGILSLLGALTIKELGRLTVVLPSLQDKAKEGIAYLENYMVSAAQEVPEGIRPVVTRSVESLFSSGEAILTPSANRVLHTLGNVIGRLPDGAFGLGTFLLAGYMISARLPQLKAQFSHLTQNVAIAPYLSVIRSVRKTVGHWLLAQLKLATITFSVVTLGLVILGVSYAPAWALFISLVDAMPILGSGVILIPWALICLLQGNHFQAIGILCTYAAATILRTSLEPRLVGKQLGLDPLLTLLFLYVGYRLFGIIGMLLSPILAAVVKGIVECIESNKSLS